VAGRGTKGAAVMGLDEPICGVGGTMTTCAEAMTANAVANIVPAMNIRSAPGEEVFFMGLVSSRTCEDAAQYSTQNGNLYLQNAHIDQIYGQFNHFDVNLLHYGSVLCSCAQNLCVEAHFACGVRLPRGFETIDSSKCAQRLHQLHVRSQ
jgi:hypothetical protein